MDRFWRKVKVRRTDQCWMWLARRVGGRYGHFWLDGRLQLAHRVSWEMANGPVPEGLRVLHTCDEPACVNPQHLFLGTQLDNMADLKMKGRAARGEKCWRSKLTTADVRKIRRLSSKGMQHVEIARQFPVGEEAICRIVNRKRWEHVA